MPNNNIGAFNDYQLDATGAHFNFPAVILIYPSEDAAKKAFTDFRTCADFEINSVTRDGKYELMVRCGDTKTVLTDSIEGADQRGYNYFKGNEVWKHLHLFFGFRQRDIIEKVGEGIPLSWPKRFKVS